MSRYRWLLAVGVLVGLVNVEAGPAYRSDRIIIKPKSGKDLKVIHSFQGAKVLHQASESELQVVEVEPGSVEQKLVAYRQSGAVEFAEPDYILHASTAPNDPQYVNGTLWALHNTGQKGGQAGADLSAEYGWNGLSSASNVVVAIIDTGVRYTHEDLVDNIWTNNGEIDGNGKDDDGDGVIDDVHGYNAIDSSGDPWDDAGHGTHVAGIIGAAGNNGVGVVGVAWSVQLMACKFMDSTGEGATSDAIRCIDFARKHGAQIINASWGAPGYSLALLTAIKRARSAGIIFVAAAGNESSNLDRSPSYPASYVVDNLVAVAATTRQDVLADYSNYGLKSVLLAAPGSQIYSTWFTSDHSYTTESGTSMATPFVAGVFALVKAQFPNETYKQLIQRVKAAIDPLANLNGKCVTGGRINLRKALGVALPARPVQLSAVTDARTGTAQFSFAGDANAKYTVEVSNDLVTWETLVTAQAGPDGSLGFSDDGAAQNEHRFYRAVLVPVQ